MWSIRAIKEPDSQQVSAIRLGMAQAFAQMLLKAYEALLYHGINYRDLAPYKDQTLLEEAKVLVIAEGRNRYLLWIERTCNAIDAAVRRKQFRVLTKTPPENPSP